MRTQSDTEIQNFFGVVNDQRFNSMCIRITTELTPTTVKIEGAIAAPTEGDVDAELGRDTE